jgi:hypothetical protein
MRTSVIALSAFLTFGCSYSEVIPMNEDDNVSQDFCVRARTDEFYSATSCKPSEGFEERSEYSLLKDEIRLVVLWFNQCKSGDCGKFQEDFDFCKPKSIEMSDWSVRDMKSSISVEIPCRVGALTFLVAEISNRELTPRSSILEVDVMPH